MASATFTAQDREVLGLFFEVTTLILTLTNGHPYPAPVGQDFSGPALTAVLQLPGVQAIDSFQGEPGKSSTIITFDSRTAYRSAKALTGWPEWDDEGLMLEARLSPSGFVVRWLHPGYPDWPTLVTEFRAMNLSA